MKKVGWKPSDWNRYIDFVKSQSQYKILKSLYEEKEFDFMTYKELMQVTGLYSLSLTRNLKELCQSDPAKVALVQELKLAKRPESITAGQYRKILSELDEPTIVMTKFGVYKLRPQMRRRFDEMGGVGVLRPLGVKRPRSHTRMSMRDDERS